MSSGLAAASFIATRWSKPQKRTSASSSSPSGSARSIVTARQSAGGLGEQILPVLSRQLDGHMGDRWEAAFRRHLLRMAAAGVFG